LPHFYRKSTMSSLGVKTAHSNKALDMKKESSPPKSQRSPEKNGAIAPSKQDGVEEINHSDDTDLFFVGIGASAGGLEAFQSLLPNLPEEDNIIYIIAQHLDPSHPTMLVSLLKRYTSMPVSEIQDKESVEPGRIYITPPGSNVTFSNGLLRLSKPLSAIGPKPSIDLLFTSLAENLGDKTVGIILSGTGSDGAHGIRAIKAEGGITIVQTEETARYNGMPHAAIETGFVDLTLTPEKIGKELLSVIKYPHLASDVTPAEQAPEGLDHIFTMLLDQTGCDFSDYKVNTINRRIGRRMVVNKLVELNDYVRYLKHSPKELELLFKDILISVTSFFRDSDAFKSLGGLIPRIINHKQAGDTIRVWIPGCSTGEEAYSIAILFSQALGEKIRNYNLQIFGSDLDQEAINKARRGVYPEATVVDVDRSLLDHYFVRKDNTVQVVESIREIIVFAKHNLIKDPPFSHLDLISCRNLLIYFNSSLQKRIVPLFHYVLNPNGYLFLGKSESIGQFSDLFSTVSKKWKIYQRRGVFRAPLVDFRRSHGAQSPVRQLKGPSKEVSSREIMNEALAESFGPGSALIDERLQIVYVRGDLSSYLSIPEGEAGLDILNLAKPNLRIDLRTMIYRANREAVRVTSHPLSITVNGREIWFKIHVNPIQVTGAPAGLLLVSFEEIKTPERLEVTTTSNGDDPRVYELEQELAAMKEHLQTTVEELETSNEELMSLNEELQSSNEELQSSNEELETTNEELQSTNEELTTVNEELQVKSGELASANTDLENILKQIGFPLVIVDKDLKVTRFNAESTRIFTLMAGDIGQVITTIGCNVYLPDLREKLLKVIKQNVEISEQVQANGRTYTMQINPHYGEYDRQRGAILIFIDKTDIVRAEREKAVTGVISQLFLNAESLEKTFTELPKIIADQYGFPYVAIELFDERTNEFTVSGAFGVADDFKTSLRIPKDATICGNVIDQTEPLYLEDASEDRDFKYPLLNDVNVGAMFCVPLRARDKVFGVLSLADVKKRKDITIFKQTIRTIANHLALEINRKKTEDTHKLNQRIFDEFYQKAPVALLTCSAEDGTILNYNQAAGDMLDYEKESLLHKSVFDFLADNTGKSSKIRTTYEKAAKEEAPKELDVKLKQGDGRIVPIRLTVLPVSDSSGRVDRNTIMITEDCSGNSPHPGT